MLVSRTNLTGRTSYDNVGEAGSGLIWAFARGGDLRGFAEPSSKYDCEEMLIHERSYCMQAVEKHFYEDINNQIYRSFGSSVSTGDVERLE